MSGMPTDASLPRRGVRRNFVMPRSGWSPKRKALIGVMALGMGGLWTLLGFSSGKRFSLESRFIPQFALASTAPAAPGGALHVEELWATRGDPATAEFAAIAGMAEAPGGEVWISDGMRREILAVDARGERLRRVAGTGQGPGEVGAPGPMAAHPGGGLAVYDVVHGVQVFGPDGRFSRRVPIPDLVYNVKGFVALPGGGYVLSGGVQGRPHALHRYSATGRRGGSWYQAPATRNPQAGLLVAGGALSLAPDGGLLFSQAAPHLVLRYPPRGGVPRRIAADARLLPPVGDDFIQEKDGWRTFRWHFDQSRAVFARADGTVLNVVRRAEVDSTVWELYGPDRRLRARRTVSPAYEPWAMTRDGDILASYRHPDTDEAVATRLRLTLR